MSTVTITVLARARCVGCKFYEWQHPDYFPIGKCINKQSTVRRKDPRYAMDKRCVKWQPLEAK